MSEPPEVFDDRPPKAENIGESESTTDVENRIKRDEAEIRKTNEQNAESRKKGPKIGPNIFYHEADQRVKSRLFFSLGTVGKKRFVQNFAHVNLATTQFRDFFEQMQLEKDKYCRKYSPLDFVTKRLRRFRRILSPSNGKSSSMWLVDTNQT